MNGKILAFILWSLCALVLAGMGVACRRAKQPMAFFANAEAPKVRDARGYNRALSNVCLIGAALLELTGLPLLLAGQDSPLVLLMLPVVMFFCIGMMIAYHRIADRFA